MSEAEAMPRHSEALRDLNAVHAIRSKQVKEYEMVNDARRESCAERVKNLADTIVVLTAAQQKESH